MNTFIDDLLPLFCRDTDGPMKYPHYDNGTIIATDAHVLIIVPENYVGNHYDSVEKYPDYKKVIPSYSNDLPLFIIESSVIDKLDNAIPKEDVFAECAHCEGEGTQTCDLGHEHECEHCDGDGKTSFVIGKKVNIENHVIEIRDILFNPHYLYLINSVCKRIECSELTFYHISAGGPAVIKCDEITFILMPLLKDQENDPEVHQIITKPYSHDTLRKKQSSN